MSTLLKSWVGAMHSSALPSSLRSPKVGDIVRLSGPGGLGRAFKRTHGVGIVTQIKAAIQGRRIEYEVKWLKSEERMRFNEEDLIVVSNVDR